MKVVIMGCGRVGSRLAALLEQEGHSVTVIDGAAASFERLPAEFRGKKVEGNGIDFEFLSSIHLEEADAFVAVTEGDNRNVMAAQIAKELFQVPRVACRIEEPIRSEFYREFGLRTISRTRLETDILKEAVERESDQDYEAARTLLEEGRKV